MFGKVVRGEVRGDEKVAGIVGESMSGCCEPLVSKYIPDGREAQLTSGTFRFRRCRLNRHNAIN